MAPINFNFFALHYLNLWLRTDRRFLVDFRSLDKGKQLASIKKAATEFRVARTLQIDSDGGQKPERYATLLDILNAQPSNLFEGNQYPAVAQTILGIERQIAAAYGGKRKDGSQKSVLSATTKLLWIKFLSPIVIYDSQARKALDATEDLREFYSKWHHEFAMHKTAIEEACSALMSIPEYWYPAGKGLEREILEATSSLWFHERVLDIYLWHKGGDRKTY